MPATEIASSYPIARLAGGARTVGAWAELFPYTYGGKSGHIDVNKANGRITIRREGFYTLVGFVQFNNNIIGTRRAEFRKNGNAFDSGMGQWSGFATNSVFTHHNGSQFEWLVPGDYISLWVAPDAANQTFNQGKLVIAYMPGYARLTEV